MTRPLPRWYRHRCRHNIVEIATWDGRVLSRRCEDCGARWKP